MKSNLLREEWERGRIVKRRMGEVEKGRDELPPIGRHTKKVLNY